MTRCARTANGATRREWSRQLPGTPRPPSTRAATRRPPTTPYGASLAMIIRMRLRAGAAIPGRLSTHPLCPRSPGTGPSEQSTTQQQRRTRLPPAAPTTKSPAQDGISIESHPRSSTEPRFVVNAPSGTTFGGHSGECIVERPKVNGAVAQLPNFDTVTINGGGVSFKRVWLLQDDGVGCQTSRRYRRCWSCVMWCSQ